MSALYHSGRRLRCEEPKFNVSEVVLGDET